MTVVVLALVDVVRDYQMVTLLVPLVLMMMTMMWW